MKRNIALTLTLAAAVPLILSVSRPFRTERYGLRDAVSDGRSLERLRADAIRVSDNGLPEPKAAPADGSGGQGQDRIVLAISLYRAAFDGGAPPVTRRNAEKFIKDLGLTITHYQDNDTCLNITVAFRKPSGMLDAVKSSFEVNSTLKELRAIPEVSAVHCPSPERRPYEYSVWFKEPLYTAKIDEIVEKFRGRLTMTERYQNKAMLGSIWINAEVKSVAASEKEAENLMKRFPDKILKAEVSRIVRVMSVTSGGD